MQVDFFALLTCYKTYIVYVDMFDTLALCSPFVHMRERIATHLLVSLGVLCLVGCEETSKQSSV